MDCTVWNERHRTRLAFRRPGAGAHRDIERGKVPSGTTAVSPFLYCFTMSWWVGGSLRTCSFLFFVLGAAVKTGCMLEKYIPAKGCNKVRVHFYFLVEELLLLLLRAAAAAHNISTE